MAELTEQEIREIIRKTQREYKRKWNAENKDKVKAANERYWRKKAMRQTEQRKD